MTTAVQHKKKQVVFENEDWYKKDTDKEQEFTGIIEKIDLGKFPPKGGLGPQVTLFYQLVPYTGVRLPVTPIPLYTHNTTNSTLEKFENWEVKMTGKLTNEQLWCGFFVPVTNEVNPGGPMLPIEIVVFANDEWYKKDTDKMQEWTGTIEKYSEVNITSGGGPGPVETLFYQLRVYFKPPIILEEIIPIFSHAHHNAVLDQHLNKMVKISGKLTNSQIWPGFLTPVTTINPGGPIQPASSTSTTTGTCPTGLPIDFVVFADQDWYKKDKDRVQEWTGTLLPYQEFNIPPGGGIGPVVTLFYKLNVYFKPPIILSEELVVYSDNNTNSVLDSFLNKTVRLIGKLVNGQIWPAFLMPWSPSDNMLPPLEDNKLPPLEDSSRRVTVFANEATYKKDESSTEHWRGRLMTYDQFAGLKGVGPVVTLFYKLVYSYAPQLPIIDKIIFSDNSKNDTLDKYLNQEVLITGKLINKTEIYPGYLTPLSNIPAK